MAGRGRKRRRPRRPQGRETHVRDRAKALLRDGGEALERGDRETGVRLMEQALGEDPSFVEPALTLARLRDEEGSDAIADALIEEAVRRGSSMVDNIRLRNGETPKWWRDEATRPYMKALVARGWRRLARDEPKAAAEQFEKVFQMEPDDDPVYAGVYAAESRLHCRDPMAALQVYSRLDEGPDVCFGRALALLLTGQTREAVVSLWLGILLNAAIAERLSGPDALSGVDRRQIVADEDQADEFLGRVEDLWDAPSREVVRELLDYGPLEDDLQQWGILARALDEAGPPHRQRQLLDEIERFLSVDRIERLVSAYLTELDRSTPARLPTV